MAGLAACDGEEPAPTGPPTSEEPTSDEPTSDEPTGAEVESPVPRDSIASDDVHGAEAAAEYFTELYPYAYATGDLDEFEEISHPDCTFCNSVIENVHSLHDQGGRSIGGAVEIVSVESRAPIDDNPYFAVDIVLNQAPSRDIASDGTETGSEGGRQVLLFAVARNDNDWIIREVEVDSDG